VQKTRVLLREGWAAIVRLATRPIASGLRSSAHEAWAPRATWVVSPQLPIAALIVGGAVLRFAGSLDQLWFDEVWTLHLVRGISSPIELLTRVTLDNNHILNSLYVWLVGVSAPSVTLRLLTVASSVGSLLVAQRLMRHRPAGERVLGTALLALSFPLIVYGSEARGYAGATFFALAAAALLDGVRERRSLGMLALLWGAIVLGGLSHPTFLIVVPSLAAGGLWTAIRGRSPRAVVSEAMRTLAVPLLVLAGLYWPRLMHPEIGGVGSAANCTPLDAFRGWLAILAGTPRIGPWAWPLAISVLLALVTEIYVEGRAGEREWPFRATLILVPVLVVAVVRPSFLFLRYFLVTVPFLLLVLARLLSRLSQRFPAVTALLALAVLASGINDSARFLEIGRGHYREVVTYIGRHGGARTSVTSDHDGRTGMLLAYYVPRLGFRQRVDYHSFMDLPAEGTDWLITHSFERDPTPPLIEQRGPWKYRLVYHAPYFGELSGFHWFLYQRAPPTKSPGG
jgi:hypothetical protein